LASLTPDTFFDRRVTLFCERGSNQGLELQKTGTDEGWSLEGHQ